MKDLLLKLHQSRLNNAEALQYHSQIRAEIATDAAVETALGAALTAYDVLLSEVDAAFGLDEGSLLTEQVAAADAARDRIVTGLKKHCETMTYHPQAAMSEAAELLIAAMEHFGDRLPTQTYNAESASVDGLLSNFASRPDLSAALTTIGADMWIPFLTTAQANFEALYAQRTTEKAAEKLPYTMRQKRTELGRAWQKLSNKIEAHHNVTEGAAPWDGLVAFLNVLTKEYKDGIAIHAGWLRTKRDEAKGQEA